MIHLNNYTHGRAIAEAANYCLNSASDVVMSRTSAMPDKSEQLRGGIIYHSYTKRSIGCHLAGFDKHWISHDLLWTFFNYPFVDLKCQKFLASIRSSNYKTLELAVRLGFKEMTRITGVYPGAYYDADLVIFEMQRDDCRWLRMKSRNIKRLEAA